MKHTLTLLITLLLAPLPLLHAADTAQATKPNIIFILADDIGYGDFGCYGATKVKMPEIFGDHMVLQEGAALVWGDAAPGEKITVTYEGATANGVAGKEGE